MKHDAMCRVKMDAGYKEVSVMGKKMNELRVTVIVINVVAIGLIVLVAILLTVL